MAATLFAYQVFLPLATGDPLRTRLHRAITLAPARSDAAGKRAFYRGIVELLLPSAPTFVRGNWDYTDEAAEAEAEYQAWCLGTVLDARERPWQEGRPADGQADGATGEPRHLFLTLLLLLERGSADDRRLEAATLAIAPAERWRRRSFGGLLAEVAALDLEALRSDAVYLCPGVDEHGLTGAELEAPRYRYLHLIEG